jgi:uncharacterized protein (DUF2235 family)
LKLKSAGMSATLHEARNLIVCCDGTGNVWKPGPGKTNVVKLVECLVRDPRRQLYYYDPGVGTPDGYVTEAGQGWRAIMQRVGGLIWGDGVWANVAGAYSFIVHNYRPGDRIFFFGFSRGAFTARAAASLVDMFGVLRVEHENLVPTLLRVYRSKPKSRADARAESSVQARLRAASALDAGGKPVEPPPAGATRRDVGDSLRRAFSHDERTPIHFVGVWDTVESVGLNQLALGSRITSEPTVKPGYRHVRHALALDELRWPYEPRLYIDPQFKGSERTFKQVWFAGAHSDVGGGYARPGVANAPLHWMLREASLHGLLVDFRIADEHGINVLDTLHNETVRLPLWVCVGAFRRSHDETPKRSLGKRIATLFRQDPGGSASFWARLCDVFGRRPPQGTMCVHETVLERSNALGARYAPALAPSYTVERTTLDYRDNGVAVSRAPPRASSTTVPAPVKESWTVWHSLWLLVATLAAWWAFSRYRADELALAAKQWADGFAGNLRDVLETWHPDSGERIDTLLWSDTIAIACYGLLLPIVAFALLRVAGRDGAARPILGKAFCYSASFLPVADFLENLFTYFALHQAPAGPLWSYATFAAGFAKYSLLAAFLLTATGCLVAWVVNRLRVAPPVARPAT